MTPPSDYQFLAVFLGIAALVPIVPLGLAYVWGRALSPAKPSPSKNASYECGIEPVDDSRVQFKSQYYLYGIIFLVLDVEAIFLIPIAVAFVDISVGALIGVFIFMLLLVEGLGWAWCKGFLTWK